MYLEDHHKSMKECIGHIYDDTSMVRLKRHYELSSAPDPWCLVWNFFSKAVASAKIATTSIESLKMLLIVFDHFDCSDYSTCPRS